MGEHAALGKARGARGVLDVEQVVGAGRCGRGEVRRAFGEQVRPVVRRAGAAGPDADDPLGGDAGREGIDGVEHGEVVAVDDQEIGVRVEEHVLELARGIAVVDRHHDRAERREREPRERIGGEVRQHERDVGALADPDSRERVGEAPHLLPRPGEGETLALLEVVQELALAEALHRGIEQRAHGLGKGAPFHLGVPGADLFRSSHDSPFRHHVIKGPE